MYEKDLKRIVCLFPELIEKGLIIKEEEFPIRSENSTYRCDLKGEDSKGNTIYIELKLEAKENVVYQIGKYKTFLKDEGRFMVAAFQFKDDLVPVLEAHGYENKLIDYKKANALLEVNLDNPQLYERRQEITLVKKTPPVNIKLNPTKPVFDNHEREILSNVFNELESLLKNYVEHQFELQLIGLDIRKKDEHRLLFQSPTAPGDRFVIYTRPRDMNIIDIQFVPDFSFTTGYTTQRKEAFKTFMKHHEEDVAGDFGFDQFHSRTPKDVLHFGDHLDHRKQAWKGITYRLVSPMDEWDKPDFPQFVSMTFISFVEKVWPYLEKFSKDSKSLYS